MYLPVSVLYFFGGFVTGAFTILVLLWLVAKQSPKAKGGP